MMVMPTAALVVVLVMPALALVVVLVMIPTAALVVVLVMPALALMVVLVMPALALVVVLVMMPTAALVVMLVVMSAAALVVVFVMSAFALMIVLVMMPTAALVVVLVITALALMLVVMPTAALVVVLVVMSALALVIMFVMVVVVVMLAFRLQVGKLLIQGVAAFHGGENLGAGQLIPRGGDEGGSRVVLTDEGNGGGELVLGHACGAGEDDGICVLYLVVEELAKVLHVHFALVGVNYCGEAIELQLVGAHVLYCADNIAELAYAGGLYQYAVRGVLLQYLAEGLAKVAYKAAADTAGVHFGHFNACFFKEAAVNAYLAEFVFYKHQLFPVECFGNELFDECGLTCAQEAGKNIYLCHGLMHLFSLKFCGGRRHKAIPPQLYYSQPEWDIQGRRGIFHSEGGISPQIMNKRTLEVNRIKNMV